jgi:DNA-binding LacI/PurR family transcriptional regulator
MSVTIKEIARRTGLSIPTVGNVLGRAASRYSAETRQRVLKAAADLGYKPNASARAMRQGRFGCASLVLSRSKQQTHSHIPNRLLDGLEDELAQHDMHLTVSRLTDEELITNDFVPKVLRQHMADGMIVNYTHEIPPAMLELIRAHHTPAVWLNAKLDADCVYPDDYGAAKSATEHLIKFGHKRIALVHMIAPFPWYPNFQASWRVRHYSVSDRAAGYTDAVADAGLPPRIFWHDRLVGELEQFEACRALLSTPDRPTAMLLYSEAEVGAVVCAAKVLGLKIPQDLSILAFMPLAMTLAGERITNVAIPTEEQGRRAIRMLLEKLTSPEKICSAQALPYDLGDDRRSIAPPPPPQV